MLHYSESEGRTFLDQKQWDYLDDTGGGVKSRTDELPKVRASHVHNGDSKTSTTYSCHDLKVPCDLIVHIQ